MSDKKSKGADFFLKMYGEMRKEKKRVSLLKRELYYFLLAAGADNDSRDQYLYSSNVFHARMYTHAVRIAWLKHAVWIWLMYLAVQWGILHGY